GDERLGAVATLRVGYADDGRVAYVGVLAQHLLDLHRAHRPSGRADDVVGSSAVVEVAVGVDPAPVLERKPLALPSYGDLPRLSRPEHRAVVAHDGDLPAGRRLAEGAGTHLVAREPGIVHDDDADLGAAVHPARSEAERPLEPFE